MKRFVALLGFFVALAAGLSAETAAVSSTEAALDPIDFRITLKELHQAATSGDDRGIPGGRTFIIDAEIGSVTVKKDDAENFWAEVELIGGAWISETTVNLYRAYADFTGPQFRAMFSRKSPEQCQPGEKLLILSRFMGLIYDYDQVTPVSLIEAIEVRLLP